MPQNARRAGCLDILSAKSSNGCSAGCKKPKSEDEKGGGIPVYSLTPFFATPESV
ncbi:MAG: hypothetical protein Q4A78_01850 [Peptostreptococcaceae bacterium]|nr:hypothetical protein [Peptostreptococcaceae bacterium]